jgi:hypothetical protein
MREDALEPAKLDSPDLKASGHGREPAERRGEAGRRSGTDSAGARRVGCGRIRAQRPHLFPRPFIPRCVQVVDVGGGTGFCTLGIVKSVPGSNVTLIDQSPHQLAKARKKPALKDVTIEEVGARGARGLCVTVAGRALCVQSLVWTLIPAARCCVVCSGRTSLHAQSGGPRLEATAARLTLPRRRPSTTHLATPATLRPWARARSARGMPRRCRLPPTCLTATCLPGASSTGPTPSAASARRTGARAAARPANVVAATVFGGRRIECLCLPFLFSL